MNSALARSGLVALGCTLACGNDAREAERLRTAGGETTEFSGDVAACPEIVSSTPIDRADPRVAPWVALAEGRREVSLRWEREFVSDAVTGFEEHTSATFDVRVVGVADVTYGAGGSAEHEDVCAGRVERHFELELDLTTADGALAGTLQYYAQPTGDADEPSTLQLVDANLRLDNGRYALDELGGALELGAPYAGAVVGFWSASFTFDAGALRGIVRPLVGADERSLWSPVSARFPDDGCSPLQPLSLDEPSAALGESPRQAHQRLRALIAADSAPARWAPPRGAGAAPELDDTEVTLGLGEATHACLAYGDTVYVNAPLTLTSADGRVGRHALRADRLLSRRARFARSALALDRGERLRSRGRRA